MLLFANPSIPLVGMGRPTTSLLHFHLGPGQVSGGTLSGSFPPKTNCTWEFPFIRLESFSDASPGILSFFVELVHARANEHQPQQQETMTNRVRHLATSARKRNVVLVEAFFSLLVKGARDVRGVRAFRTTERSFLGGSRS